MAESASAANDVPATWKRLIAGLAVGAFLVLGAGCTGEPGMDDSDETIENNEPAPDPTE